MALPPIPSVLGFGILILILILLPLLKFLNSFFATADFLGWKNGDDGGRDSTSGGGGDRPSTSGGGGDRPSTSGGGGGRFALHRAAREGNLKRVQRALSGLQSEQLKRETLKLRDASKQTPLSLAASNNHANVVDYLVKEMETLGVPIFSDDMKDVGPEKSHPIHRACIEGHLDVVRTFCRLCQDLKLPPQTSMFAPNYHGQTILHLAAENGRAEIFEYLLTLPECQCQKDAKDKHGRTPRDLAQHHPGLAQILWQADTGAL